jgi:hypothetical protein
MANCNSVVVGGGFHRLAKRPAPGHRLRRGGVVHPGGSSVRCILKVRAFGGQDDVAKERVFRMHGDRSVDGGNHRHFDIKDVLQDLGTFAQDLVVSHRSEEIEPFGRDTGAELISRAGENHDVIIPIIPDVAERVNQRLVHVSIELERAASRFI